MMGTIKRVLSAMVRPRFYFELKTAHDMILVGIAKIVESIASLRTGCRTDYSTTMWALFSEWMISDRSSPEYKRPPLAGFFREMFTIGLTVDRYTCHRSDKRWMRAHRLYVIGRLITGIGHVVSFGIVDLELDSSAMLIAEEFEWD